jgi:hypothetical protein
MKRMAAVFLAFALVFAGDASGRSSHRNQTSPIHQCLRDGAVYYAPGAYCVSARGAVEVCLSDGGWMSIGACKGEACRKTC